MATRLYFNRTPGFTQFNPTVQGGWGADFHVDYALVTAANRQDSGFLTRTVATNASAGTACHMVAYSLPMNAGYAWTGVTFDVCYRILEALTTMNVFAQFYCGICNNDGSIIKEVSALEKDGTEAATSLTSRLNATAGGKLTTVSVPGDRLFIEIGWDKDAAVSGDVSISYGDSTTSGDLIDADTGIQNPWCEVSNDIVFDAEGTTYGVQNQLMMTGVGT